MIKQLIQVEGSKVLLMGLTFKENCPDIRNTKIVDIVRELKEYNIQVDITDPWCSSQEVKSNYDLTLVEDPENGNYDAIVIAVAHTEFKELGPENIRKLGKENHVLYDLKYILPKDTVDIRF